MFERLQTKLTVLYAGLFGATLLLISGAVYTAVTRNAEQIVRDELAANSAVFNRIWSLRSMRLREEADVLARDFGFRAAVATGDAATVRSALENLRVRMGVDAAFVVGLDGRVVSAQASGPRLPQSVIAVVQDQSAAFGAFSIGDQPYYGATAAVMAPTLAGVLVFAKRLDRPELGALEKLAALPLHASVVVRRDAGGWRAADARAGVDRSSTNAFVSRALASPGARPRLLKTHDGPAAAEATRLRALGGGEQIALLVYYPMAEALAPLTQLLFTIAAFGLGGLSLMVVGSWALAATVTRPLSALEAAAKRLQHGEPARVEVTTRDELARLGYSFNAMAADIRDRERRLERAKDLAETANRAKSFFLANMSHELRTPLNGVIGVVGVLAGSALDAKQRRMVSIVETSALMLQRVLNDVLEAARTGSAQAASIQEPFDLTEFIDRLASTTELRTRETGVAFELAYRDPAPTWVRSDRVRLEQILDNLLSNALKFTPAGKIVLTVDRAEAEADVWRFVVADTGVGFDPAVVEQLFEPFVQADASATRPFGGTGLGLSIARNLALELGGDLVGEGKPGEGAAFTLTVPLPSCAPAETSRPAPASDQPGTVDRPVDDDGQPGGDPDAAAGAAVRILLADDHATNRTVVQLILESVGIELVAVENGAEAVEMFKTQHFDAVLMDLQMPVMDGLTAVRLIREYEQRVTAATRTPVLILSANNMPEHLEGSAAAGADDHLAKPVLASVLLEALQRVLSPDSGAQPIPASNIA